jgi:hypothetical protein
MTKPGMINKKGKRAEFLIYYGQEFILYMRKVSRLVLLPHMLGRLCDSSRKRTL